MSRGIVYLITNKETGHKYVGSTTLPMNRIWQQHIQDANKMSSKMIHSEMRKYGNHRFGIQEIDECDESLLIEKEQYWIKHYKPEYNPIVIDNAIENKVKAPLKITKPSQPSNYKPWGSLTEENRGNGKHSGLKIRGKNLETGVCTDYESARVAAEQITGDPNKNSNILLAARKGGTAYGHKWQILEDKRKKKAVFSVSKTTGEIEHRFDSIADAVRTLGNNSSGTGLVTSLRNPGRYSWKGAYWFYARGL